MDRERIVELDVMKFWGIMLVVLGHVTNMYTPMGLIQPVTSSEGIGSISYFIYQFHMPLFVFVSGSVYAYQYEILNKRNPFLSFVRNKFKRLLIPYVFFGVLLAFFMVGLGLRDDLSDYLYNGVVLSKDSRHLWYVLMLFEVFILFWLMNNLIEKIHLSKWWHLAIAFISYLLAGYIPYVFQLSSAFRYLFWFALGYVFVLHKEVICKVVNNYLLGGVILIVGVLSSHDLSSRVPFMSTIVAIAGILLFYHISCDFKRISNNKIFKLISRNSYGIYLYHVFVVYFWFFLFKDYSFSPLLMVVFSFVLSLVLSVLLTEITRKIGMGIVIGEKKKH